MINFKKLAALSMASAMVLAPSSAFAQGVATTTVISETAQAPSVAIQLNGTNMSFTDAQPVIVNSRVYVPFRAVFEGLDAEVSYDDATKTITAKKDTTEAVFVVGNKNMTIKKDGTNKNVETDAASFIKNGRTYVPVRFAAQALDCTVGWDDDDKTAIIFDADEVTGANETYTIMDKYLAYAKEFSEKTYALTGTFNFSVNNIDGSSDKYIKGVCNIDGITDSSKVNMNTVTELDLSAVEKMIDAESAPDAETLALLEALKSIDFNLIFNLDTGKYYIQSSLFSTLMGSADDTWYSIDMNSMMEMSGSSFSFTDLAKMAKAASFETYMHAMSTEISTTDKDSAALSIETYKLITGIFSDSAFKTVADGYESTYKQETDGATVTLSMKLPTADDKVTGCSFDMSMDYMGSGVMKLTAEQNGLKSSMDMSINVEDIFDMTLTGNFDYAETTNAPIGEPTDGSKVISLNDMMMQ
ncbi:MAG TPA: hypothetical protein DIC60_02465 [Lachnospiraceae bacterium]|nr:hypothetical protein [Lachnospiraceae bacterium]